MFPIPYNIPEIYTSNIITRSSTEFRDIVDLNEIRKYDTIDWEFNKTKSTSTFMIKKEIKKNKNIKSFTIKIKVEKISRLRPSKLEIIG